VKAWLQIYSRFFSHSIILRCLQQLAVTVSLHFRDVSGTGQWRKLRL